MTIDADRNEYTMTLSDLVEDSGGGKADMTIAYSTGYFPVPRVEMALKGVETGTGDEWSSCVILPMARVRAIRDFLSLALLVNASAGREAGE